MAQSTCELMWIHQLLSEIGLDSTQPFKIWCDNQVALHIALNLFFMRTKHIEADCHFIHERIQQNSISTSHVKTGERVS